MFLRKIGLSIVLIFCLLTNSISFAYGDELPLNGKAAALIDSKSGTIIYGHNENMPLPPASTTKILTAILAVEKSKPTDIVTVGKNPTLCEPTILGLREGEKMSMEDLLYALLIRSANDTAVAIAEHIAGSVPEFAKLMNERAKEWGATNSNFVNPNGWPDPNHHSSAHDLALIAKHVMENDYIRTIVATRNKTIHRENDDDIKLLLNHNKILTLYEGANGVKTGYTTEAKQCLVASAVRGDQEFIAVVLGAQGSNVWSDASTLLDYGFKNFDTYKYKNANELVKTITVADGTGPVKLVTEKDFYYTLKKGETANVTEQIELNQSLAAPVKKGQVMGKLKFMSQSKELGSVNLIAQNDVERSVLIPDAVTKSPINPLLAASILLGIFVLWNLSKRKKYKYRRRKRNWKIDGIR